MSKKAAISRLRKELKAFMKDPPPFMSVAVSDDNFFNWSYLLEGPPNTPCPSRKPKGPPPFPFPLLHPQALSGLFFP